MLKSFSSNTIPILERIIMKKVFYLFSKKMCQYFSRETEKGKNYCMNQEIFWWNKKELSYVSFSVWGNLWERFAGKGLKTNYCEEKGREWIFLVGEKKNTAFAFKHVRGIYHKSRDSYFLDGGGTSALGREKGTGKKKVLQKKYKKNLPHH